MKKNKIRKMAMSLTAIFVLLVGSLAFTVHAEDNTDSSIYVDGQEDVLKIDGYMNDYAHLLSDSAKQKIEEKGAQLEKDNGAQVVFVTVDSLGDKDINDVSYETFNYYHIGSKDNDNGVLFIVERNGNHNFRMEVGTGLEGSLTDITTKHLQEDYMVKNFHKNEFEKGIVQLYNKTAEVIDNPSEYQNKIQDEEVKKNNNNQENNTEYSFSTYLGLGIFGLMVALFGVAAVRQSMGKQKYYETFVGGNIEIGGSKPKRYTYINQSPDLLTIDERGTVRAIHEGLGKVTLHNIKNNKDFVVQIQIYSAEKWREKEDEEKYRSSRTYVGTSSSRSNSSFGFSSHSSNSEHSSFSGGGGHSAGGGSHGQW